MSILLIRHTAVSIDSTLPSDQWQVSQHGRTLTHQLAAQITPLPSRILTSVEPKAVVTGQLLAQHWDVPIQSWPSLHEHERGDNRFVADRETWLGMVAQFLRHPNTLVMGTETAVEAAQRFETAVIRAKAQFPQDKLAIVSHGRILTSFLMKHNRDLDPIPFWQSLTLPAAIKVDKAYQIKSII